MEKKSFLEKISSKYIIQNIFSYIKDNQFLLKLILYSRLSQNKMNIKVTLKDLKENYLNNRIKWKNYFFYPKEYFLKDISKFNITINNRTIMDMTDILVNYIKKNIKTIKKYEKGYERDYGCIDLFSTFFDTLSKLHSDIFNEFFTIFISSQKIEGNNLEDAYINKFKELAKLKINFESLRIEYINDNDMQYFKDFQINCNQLKKLQIICYSTDSDPIKNPFAFLFPLIKNATNLIYLSIRHYHTERLKSNEFTFINNNKNLKCLKLIDCYFDYKFILNIPTLEYLDIIYCSEVDASKETYLNLKSLCLDNSYAKINTKEFDSLLNLEEIKITYKIINDNNDKINLKKLKRYEGTVDNFSIIESPLLEEVKIKETIEYFQKFEMFIKKIPSFKFLKVLKLRIKAYVLNDEKLSGIQFENNSITDLDIEFYDVYQDTFILFSNFQSKFHNPSNLYIHYIGFHEIIRFEETIPVLQIIENPKSKVRNLNIDFKYCTKYSFGFNIYISNYENLETFRLYLSYFPLKLKIPFVTDKCYKIMTSLKSFNLELYLNHKSENNYDIFTNIYDNIDKMPNLIDFTLTMGMPNDNSIKDNIYKLFCEKILLLKYIKRINIHLFPGINYYSKKELIKIYPNINFDKFYEVKIFKKGNKICNIY